MSQARESRTFKTPSGVEIIIYTYLTAAESNCIKEIMMRAMKIDIADLKVGSDAVPLKGQIDGTILMEQENLLVKYLVKECPGSIDDLREADYQALVKELNTIRNGNLPEAK